MRINELLETAVNTITPQELWNDLLSVLKGYERDLSYLEQNDAMPSIGGNLRMARSGQVALERNFQSHSRYGGSTTWNLALKIGNNINKKDGKALDHTIAVYQDLQQIAHDAADAYDNVKILGDSDGTMRVGVDNREFSVRYEYASNFCWVAVRVAK